MSLDSEGVSNSIYIYIVFVGTEGAGEKVASAFDCEG